MRPPASGSKNKVWSRPDGVDFAVCCVESSVTVVLTWLVPITSGEAKVVRRHGWAVLEHAVADRDPDLTDPRRSKVTFTQPDRPTTRVFPTVYTTRHGW